MFKHSSAPWFLGTAGTRIANKDGLIASTSIQPRGFERSVTENEANARLIAISPELLQSLIYLTDLVDNAPFELSTDQEEQLYTAKKLISKLKEE